MTQFLLLMTTHKLHYKLTLFGDMHDVLNASVLVGDDPDIDPIDNVGDVGVMGPC